MPQNRMKDFIKPYRIGDGKSFQLKDVDPADTGFLGSEDKQRSRELLQGGITKLAALQEKLYAADQWGLLLIFQAMDAAGKDSAIKHVMSGVNPQGCQVSSFKAPSLVTKHIWMERYEDINAMERYLTRNGIAIRKFFLHVSPEVQRKRLLERLEDPKKNWKFSVADAHERDYWDDYMDAYERMVRHTSSTQAPWFVVPADNKWFTRLVVAASVIDALEDMQLAFPKVGTEKRKELQAVREILEASDTSSKHKG